MRKQYLVIAAFILISPLLLGNSGCDGGSPVSSSGVKEASVKIQAGADGLTTEQRNIADRLKEDNKPGSIKHLYIISAYSGQVIIYSTVRGKVTSGGKRLTPTAIVGRYSNGSWYTGIPVNIGRETVYTGEILQDDGTYGHSADYLYWWGTKGVYHQNYVSGGQILHISNQPLAVKSIIINMELAPKAE